MTDKPDLFYHTIRVQSPSERYWGWCCETLKTGTWLMRTGFMGSSATYCFINEQDLLAFRLRFGL